MKMFTTGLFRMFVMTKVLGVDSVVLQLNNPNKLSHSGKTPEGIAGRLRRRENAKGIVNTLK